MFLLLREALSWLMLWSTNFSALHVLPAQSSRESRCYSHVTSVFLAVLRGFRQTQTGLIVAGSNMEVKLNLETVMASELC